MKRNIVAFSSGLVFAIGLGVSGMTQPQKIIGFLDIQNWDPTLIFVMMGAIFVHALTYKVVRKRSAPLLDVQWHVPTKTDLDKNLIFGSILFGMGWSIGGYCPGPSIVSLVTGQTSVFIFVLSMLMGMFVFINLTSK